MMFNRKHVVLIVLCSTILSTNLMSQIALQGSVTNNGGAYLGSGAEPVVNAMVTIIDQADTNRTV